MMQAHPEPRSRAYHDRRAACYGWLDDAVALLNGGRRRFWAWPLGWLRLRLLSKAWLHDDMAGAWDVTCRCGHPAARHHYGEQHIEGCKVCGCAEFGLEPKQ